MSEKRMSARYLFVSALMGLLLAFAGVAHADHHKKDGMAKGTIVEVADKAGQFSTLLAAAKAAGLVETLSGEGPLTVFAPTDEAFAALPEGAVESLLEPENQDKLKSILTYHVVAGKVMAKDVMGMSSADTVNGATLDISTSDGMVMVDDATVVKADVKASNGVIHVIDKVLMP